MSQRYGTLLQQSGPIQLALSQFTMFSFNNNKNDKHNEEPATAFQYLFSPKDVFNKITHCYV